MQKVVGTREDAIVRLPQINEAMATAGYSAVGKEYQNTFHIVLSLKLDFRILIIQQKKCRKEGEGCRSGEGEGEAG